LSIWILLAILVHKNTLNQERCIKIKPRSSRGHDCMVVGFITTYAIK
jgi:hypothetical protein